MGDTDIADLERKIAKTEALLNLLRNELKHKEEERQRKCKPHHWKVIHQMYESFSLCCECGKVK